MANNRTIYFIRMTPELLLSKTGLTKKELEDKKQLYVKLHGGKDDRLCVDCHFGFASTDGITCIFINWNEYDTIPISSGICLLGTLSPKIDWSDVYMVDDDEIIRRI